MVLDHKIFIREVILYILCTAIGLFAISIFSSAQEKLPKPISVTVVTTQDLSFGEFTQGSSGGTISVSPAGLRSSSGTVVPLSLGGLSYSAALFEIRANPGTVIGILNGPDVALTRSGGGSMNLHLGSSSPSSPFITTAIPPSTTSLTIGGTLTVGTPAANPPGNYSGVFYITFIQE